MDAQQLLTEAKPMLDDVLGRIGLHETGEPLELEAIAPSFDSWLKTQEISPADFGFMVMVVGGSIVEYLTQHHKARPMVVDGRPAIQLTISPSVVRQFDPYSAAAGLIKGNRDLLGFLSAAGS